MNGILFCLSIPWELYDALIRILLSFINITFYLHLPTLSIEIISGIIFSLLKISAFIFLFIFGVFLALRIFKKEGIVVMPFDIPTINEGMNFTGKLVSDILIAELKRIERVHHTKLEGPRDMGLLWQPKTEPTSENLLQLDISSKGETLEFGISEIGTIGFGSTSLSLSNLIIAFKRLCPLSEPVSIITGGVGFFGSVVKITGCLEGRDAFAWEVSRKFGKNETSDMHIPQLIRDLAFQIRFELDKKEPEPNISAVTWQGFKHLTNALDEYHNYGLTGRTMDLERSRRSCLKAVYSERKHAKAVDLLKVLGYKYLEMVNKLAMVEQKKIPEKMTKVETYYKNYYFNIVKQLFNHLIEFEPAEAHYGLGCVYMKEDKSELALLEFQEATKWNHDDYRSYYYQSRILEKQKKSKDAQGALNMFIYTAPKDLKGNYYKGLAFGSLDQEENAIEAFKESDKVVPQGPEDWNYKGLALIRLNYYETDPKVKSEYLEKALKAFQNIIDKNSQDGQAWNNIGVCHYNLEHYQKAYDAFKIASEIDPDNDLFFDNMFNAAQKIADQANKDINTMIEDLEGKIQQVKDHKEIKK